MQMFSTINHKYRAKTKNNWFVDPKKLIFENNEYRTIKTSDAVSQFCPIDEDFEGNKKGKKTDLSVSSLKVARTGFETPIVKLDFTVFIFFLIILDSIWIQFNKSGVSTFAYLNPKIQFFSVLEKYFYKTT